MATIREFLWADPPDMPGISAHLDMSNTESRVAEIRSLGKKDQARLFEAAEGHRTLQLIDIVPSIKAPLVEVSHQGKNTLPVFTQFAKVFCRPDDRERARTELWGYNRNSKLISKVVGPGYFVLRSHDGEGELLVDYTELPPKKPENWPEIIPNEARAGRFVYAGMKDILRGVSLHVSIGRATKHGKNMDAWFTLCREE